MMPQATTKPEPLRPQGDQEPDQRYALAVLHYAARHGAYGLPLASLKMAHQYYPVLVWGLGQDSQPAESFAELQREITRAISGKEAEIQDWIQTYATPAQDDQGDQDSHQGDQGEQEPEPDPRDQAIRMMRAALQLIQDPGTTDQGGGGSRVPVTPRPPKFPPGGAQATPDHQQPPTRTQPTRTQQQPPNFTF